MDKAYRFIELVLVVSEGKSFKAKQAVEYLVDFVVAVVVVVVQLHRLVVICHTCNKEAFLLKYHCI